MDLQDLDNVNSRSHSQNDKQPETQKQPPKTKPNNSKKQPTKDSAIAKLQHTSNDRAEALATAKQTTQAKIAEAGYKSGRRKAQQTYAQADNLGFIDGVLLHEIDQAENIGTQLELLDELSDNSLDLDALITAGDPIKKLLNHSISVESLNQFSTELSLLPSSEKSEN
ncbi:MAG: hypothetical protein QNJ68_02800 [Microcoleaceae cyanobacterium MO_207.B10]|nr:hypothetical protein [Microcoleaceae cyanobacterium MO_207.B10]